MPASAAVLAVAVDGTIRATAGSAGELLGTGSGDLAGRHAAEVVSEPDCSRFLDQLAVPDRPQRYLVGGRWLEAEVLDRRDDPDIGELVVRWRDVSELTAITDALATSEDRYRSLVESVHEVVFWADRQARITFVNEAWARRTGIPVVDAIGLSVLDFVHPDDRPRAKELADDLLAGRIGDFTLESRSLSATKPGPSWFEVRARPALDAVGDVVGATGIISDVTERHRAQEQLRELARHDPLTGLLNRSALFEELQATLDAGSELHGPVLAVLFLDLDDFKVVNDRFGQEAGDTVLELAARRLQKLVRAEDRAGRVGGDEFVIVSPRHPDLVGAVAFARRIMDAMSAPFDVGGTALAVSASIGIATEVARGPGDAHPRPAAHLLRAADAAMYRAKARGGGIQVATELAMVAAGP